MGARERVFSVTQCELLPHGCALIAPAVKGTRAPRRGRDERRVGEHGRYIRNEDAPDATLSRALGTELERFDAPWGRLATELAAACGPRWGEQFQLTAHDVDAAGRKVPINRIDWQIDPGAKVKEVGQNRRKRPKGEKTRVVGVPLATFTGYPLREKLLERRAAALREQAAGLNEQALLFPTKTGKLWHHSAFMADVFKPAALAAGWPYQRWQEERQVWDKKAKQFRLVRRQRMQFAMVWHSHRHRFARYAVDVLGYTAGELMATGGWESETVVKDRYYNAGEEHTESALDKLAAAETLRPTVVA